MVSFVYLHGNLDSTAVDALQPMSKREVLQFDFTWFVGS